MSYSRTVRAITKRRSERALRNYLAATEALDTGVSLRISNVTSIAKGTIHSGLANRLRRSGRYEMVADVEEGVKVHSKHLRHKAYGRGVTVAKSLQAARARGENPDVRWDFVDETKRDHGQGFNAFKKGFDDAFTTEEQAVS